MKKKIKGKKGLMELKLDMSKAYDGMECDFFRGFTLCGFSSEHGEPYF